MAILIPLYANLLAELQVCFKKEAYKTDSSCTCMDLAEQTKFMQNDRPGIKSVEFDLSHTV